MPKALNPSTNSTRTQASGDLKFIDVRNEFYKAVSGLKMKRARG